MEFDRQLIASGAPMEEKVGYSRAVRVGPFVYVGGTTSTNPDGGVASPGDAYGQAQNIFAKIGEALEKAGASFAEVVRVRIYITDISKAGDCMQAYSEIFKEIKPIATMCEIKGLFRPEQILEIEVDAIIGSAG
jgi:enamine deaminase RidA (YjgF/YER057c/UK114 family)